MIENFEFSLQKLETIHPLGLNGFLNEQKEIIKNIRKKIKKPLKRNEFHFLVNRLFYILQDGHTNLWLSWSKSCITIILTKERTVHCNVQ